eukprot:4733690-Alexandrium_andersonii.AAC.1
MALPLPPPARTASRDAAVLSWDDALLVMVARCECGLDVASLLVPWPMLGACVCFCFRVRLTRAASSRPAFAPFRYGLRWSLL